MTQQVEAEEHGRDEAEEAYGHAGEDEDRLDAEAAFDHPEAEEERQQAGDGKARSLGQLVDRRRGIDGELVQEPALVRAQRSAAILLFPAAPRKENLPPRRRQGLGHVLPGRDRPGPFPDEAVRPGAELGGHVARNGHDLPVLGQGQLGRDERAAPAGRLDHDQAQGQAADDPVPHRKILSFRQSPW